MINANVRLEQRTAKTGNPYWVMIIKFPNGYEHVVYGISNEVVFILNSLNAK